jgi:hypothetical protein
LLPTVVEISQLHSSFDYLQLGRVETTRNLSVSACLRQLAMRRSLFEA